MKYLLILVVLMQSVGQAWCMTASFTVFAPSGLNVRKAGHTQAEIVGKLPFGTVFEAEIPSDDFLNEDLSYKFFTATIEGHRGFWMKIVHEKLEGYVFSGFCMYGRDWFKTASDNTNFSCRILANTAYWGDINYDPKLNWYALVSKSGKTNLRRVGIQFKLVHARPPGLPDDYTLIPPVWVDTPLEDSIIFMIGTQKPMKEKELLSHIFQHPEETEFKPSSYLVRFNYHEHRFEYSNKQQMTNTTTTNCRTVFLLNMDGYTINVSELLNKASDCNMYEIRNGIKLEWAGDLNADGLPELLFSTFSGEGCGMAKYTFLFESNIKNMYRVVATD